MKPGDLLKSRTHPWLALALEVDGYYVELVWLTGRVGIGSTALSLIGEKDSCAKCRMEIVSASR